MTLAVAEPNESNGLVSRRREVRVVQDDGPLAYLFDTARFEHMQRIATTMAHAAFTPKHLRGQSQEETVANCFRVTLQAVRWGFDPFAVADETYVVQGRLGYQGKLVAAVVNARAGLADRLSFSFTGQGDGRTISVSGRFRNEQEPREITLSVAQAKTSHQMWQKDPDQKLVYSGTVKWARRHCQEVIMGVLTDDDVESAAVTPRIEATPPLANAGNAQSLAASLAAGRSNKSRPTIEDTAARDAQVAALTPAEESQLTPEATVVIEQPAPPIDEAQLPEIDFGDENAFYDAVEQAIAGLVDPQVFAAGYKKLMVSTGAKSPRRKEYEPARKAILAAAIAGQVDWANGKILE